MDTRFISNEAGPMKPVLSTLPKTIRINVAGDRYDGGVVITTYVNCKRVNEQILDGEQDYHLNGLYYSNYVDYATAVADFYGLKNGDVKRSVN